MENYIVFKCKMCGGTLEVTDGTSIAECPYCGARQTLPKRSDEITTDIYDRAEHNKKSHTSESPTPPTSPSLANTADTPLAQKPASTPPHRAGRRTALYVTQGAIIAALYVALTELSTLMWLSSGVIQFRISEALCVLPAFTPAAIPGLFIGCLISNLLAGGIPLDIILGSVATLIGAAGAYPLRRCRWLIPLPTVIANVLIVPPILKYAYGLPFAFGTHSALPFFMLTVGAGEVVCAYILGIALYSALLPHRKKLFL